MYSPFIPRDKGWINFREYLVFPLSGNTPMVVIKIYLSCQFPVVVRGKLRLVMTIHVEEARSNANRPGTEMLQTEHDTNQSRPRHFSTETDDFVLPKQKGQARKI